ncbi:MAG: glycosyl hydrolase [Phycisphaerae bacterium]
MNKRVLSLGLCALLSATVAVATGEDLDKGFLSPPDSARPWVYWFWLNGNITREGITADLEAMKRAGIGGVLIMEVNQGTPKGPVAFMSPDWRELFKHVVAEASRLGLEVNMNNDAGWNGSGGPWIKPEQSMQKIVWSETNIEGPKRFEDALPQPQANHSFYRDIAVLAFPTPGAFRIAEIQSKALFNRRNVPPAAETRLPPEMVIDHTRLTDLSARMDKDGRLAWDVPAGKWTVLRLGHTTTGAMNAPSPDSGRGLECDKLAKEGIEAHFAGMMGKLIDDVGPAAGKALAATHIDSWEIGTQNWTPRMREEFQKRRGYDPLRYLPAVTGRVVDSLEASERFLWDLRQTVSDLLVENYAGHLATLAQQHGLRLSIEAYGGPCDDMTYAGRADEPMCEFWIHGGAFETCKEMASAAHTYGKRIVGAEAFTANRWERWLQHPATLKALGDRVLCEGVNRFVFHRYAMQPWLNYRPGMTMGKWGLHYERTQTWWEQTLPWHEVVLGREAPVGAGPAQRRPLHQQHVHVLRQISNEALNQLGLAAVGTKIARVEQPFAICLDEHGVTVVGRVVDQVRRDSKRVQMNRLAINEVDHVLEFQARRREEVGRFEDALGRLADEEGRLLRQAIR